MNIKFLEYLAEKTFITIGDIASKGYAIFSDDRYKKILNELGLKSHTDEPLEDVNEFYNKSAKVRQKGIHKDKK